MKNLIVNIFKTLFFFDLSVIIISVLPALVLPNVAFTKLLQQALIMIVPLILSVIFYFFVEKQRLGVPLGKHKFRSLFLGLGIGILPIAISVGILKIFKGISFSSFTFDSKLWIWLIALLFCVVASELLLRGYLFSLYKKHYGFIFATIVTTLFYISLNLNLFDKPKLYIANILLFNIMLCFLLDCTGSVLTTIMARFSYTSISCILFGGLYSEQGYPVILNTVFSGKTVFTGGEYRLEGSVITLFLTSLALLIILIRNYNLIPLIVNISKKVKKHIPFKRK